MTSFSDPYAYHDAIHAAQVKAVFIGDGDFRATLASVDLDGLTLQSGSENLPRTFAFLAPQDQASIFFLADEHQSPLQNNGAALSPGELVAFRPGTFNSQQTAGPCDWASLALAPDRLDEVFRAVTGRDPPSWPETHILRPPPSSWLRLMRLHATVMRLARVAPQALSDAGIARGLQSGVEHALALCLDEAAPVRTSLARGHHRMVVRRLEEAAEMAPDRPLYLSEVCAAIGVPERTLRVSCQEQLGMGPIRYLWLRRMNLAHRALRRADPASTSVTAVATDHGFWELGRFSVAYRKLYGRSPSATLQHRS
ncbi:helix-turn-helix transcriptional regulator [Alsobacter sp. KACC 23698]|uniref:Helix-turn-helix transcriptional regulator n=1 Tax=Alsobacter sp. KACC 23698 TaxID=3149229 RepID=A0AAU7J9Q8_9HYPH